MTLSARRMSAAREEVNRVLGDFYADLRGIFQRMRWNGCRRRKEQKGLSCKPFMSLLYSAFTRQNRNFAANWICRAEPESPVGKRVLEMTPNDVLPTVAVRPGRPRFAWSNTLNTSSRSCARAAPASRTFLITEKSVLPKPGPMSALRGRLPKWATPDASYGNAKRDALVHDPATRGSQTMLLANHW